MKRGRRGIDWWARAVQIAFVVAVLAFWDFVGQQGVVSPIFLPPLRRVIARFSVIAQTNIVYYSLMVTVSEVLGAVAIASFFGLTIGYFIGRSRYAVIVFEPLLAGIFAVPIIIFLPVFILFFGIDMQAKVAFGATYAFFPIVLNTIGGIANVDPRFVTVARAMGANERQLFRRVLLPASLPVIITGLRIGSIVGFLSILGSEMIASLRGLGTRIVRLGEGMNTADMFAYIVFVIAMAAVLNITLTRMQNRFGEAEARR
jgi:ABC-type nitrate/sulfonate/bicarbonate transport system permease component